MPDRSNHPRGLTTHDRRAAHLWSRRHRQRLLVAPYRAVGASTRCASVSGPSEFLQPVRGVWKHSEEAPRRVRDYTKAYDLDVAVR